MGGGIRLFRRQQDLCFVQSVLFDQFAYLPRQRGDFGNILYPVVHIMVHGFAAQTDLYSGLNLNQYGVASPCRTICTVCGFVALS